MSPGLCGVFYSRRSCPTHRPLRGLENTAEARRDFVTEMLTLTDSKKGDTVGVSLYMV